MNMKQFKLTFLLAVLMSMVGVKATAQATTHDFEVANADGVTIFYRKISNKKNIKIVEVTFRGNSYSSDNNRYTGDVVIPASVTYGGKTYSVTNIGVSAFRGCSDLTSVTIPNSVLTIDDYAFQDCSSLTSVTIPNSVTSIELGAFKGCSSLTSITIPYKVTRIGNATFEGCIGLTSIIIPYGVKRIGYHTFHGCSGLTSVRIPNSVTIIEHLAFYKCTGLTSIEIPNSVTSIGESAFSGCSGLTSVTIGNSVTSIGNGAFYGCSGLTSVAVKIKTPLAIDSYTFPNRANAVLCVPNGSKAAYQAADYWNEFMKIVENGDADGDGAIDVNDVTSTINHILNKPTSSFIEGAADVDGDGVIDVNAVQGIINIALGKDK